MEAFGTIIEVLPAQSGVSRRTGMQWMRQMFVLQTDEQYPKKIPFDVFGEDRIKQFDLKKGDVVNISFDVDGREYSGKWFTSITCYGVQRGKAQNQQPAPQQPAQDEKPKYASEPPAEQAAPAPAPAPKQAGNADDLPF